MGYALAAAARERGAKVVLVSGPTPLAAPEDVDVIRVQTVEQMREALLLHFRSSDLVVMAAAVGDFRVATPGRGKLKKADVPATLHLVATPDILAEMGQEKGGSDRPVLIGFAAETENLDEHGREKMGGKNLDYLVANKVDVPESGFGSTTNRVVVFCRDGRADRWPLLTKKEVADRLLDQVILEKFSIPVPGDRPVA
ncbi:MAG: phosphopantothenoylcysteine decarboxylase [Acidobacteriota bacterium]